MILHRYFSSHAFETLKEAKLKTAKISEFNDPFEFLYVSVGKLSHAEVEKFIESRDGNGFLKLCNSLLEEKMPGLGVTEQEYKIFLKKEGAIEGIVKQWPAIVKEEDLSFERRRQIIDQGLRAICFADPNNVKPLDEILLWSHYANKHKGVRIAFDFPVLTNAVFGIEKMKYEDKRPQVVFALGADANQEAYKALLASAKVKSNAWKYENEYRLFTQKTVCKPEAVEYPDGTKSVADFLEVKREWVKSVDFGALCPDSDVMKITDMLKSVYSAPVVCQRAKFHPTEYALEYTPV